LVGFFLNFFHALVKSNGRAKSIPAIKTPTNSLKILDLNKSPGTIIPDPFDEIVEISLGRASAFDHPGEGGARR
jgi:hypothetical protein